jgi:dTMP kinase
VTELLLYCADRAQHTAEVIRPALAAGRIVLCDRFSDSTIAYQGHGRGLDLDIVHGLDAHARGGLLPDATFLLDCPAAVGLARAHARSGAGDRFERETLAFHEAVRQGFHSLAAAAPERYHVIDGSAPTAEVSERILAAMVRMLAERGAA